ncbi:hypothetical protein [Hamadaea tsunoensis]|uniref:hypothetical protein n=1 Tax=Hamadaea tsunoensis TaxID=53368 RepID=UPI000406302F|nr:hypothetical protein [Hamadaea tsunoensis]
MRLFPARCPVRPQEQVWIEESLDWLVREFGEPALRGQLILPTDDFFPGTYTGSVDDLRRVVEFVRRRMGVDPTTFAVELSEPDDPAPGLPGAYRTSRSAAGEYRIQNGLGVISIDIRQLARPMALVATIAHEFCHHRLLGEGRIAPDRRDHEPLTDLATIFFGFGIFAANAALQFGAGSSGWQASRLGYLTEPMFGYGLAYHAHLRDDPVAWSSHVDTNPRAYLRKGLRYLSSR